MLRYKIGNIVDAPEEVLVNAVNCVGVMGAGVALAFKQRWPEMFLAYQIACLRGGLYPGDVTAYAIEGGRVILNAATKDDWRQPSKLHWIVRCVDSIVSFAEDTGRGTVALPMLGCGLGGLSWDEVRPVYEHLLEESPIDFVVYDIG